MKNKLLFGLSLMIAFVGIVWFGQGIGLIHGSFMTSQSRWTLIGGIMIVVAAGMFWLARRR